MVASTCFGITLPSSWSVPSAFWEMLNWVAVDRILWMSVLCLVTWCVATWDRHAILTCVYEIETRVGQRYASICCDRKASLKALQTTKTTSPLVQQCQKESNAISIRHTLRLYWIPGHAGLRGNAITDKLARGSSTQTFIGPEPSRGVSRRNIKNKIKRWVDNQHLAMWRGRCCTQREAGKFISSPNPATKARLMPFNRAQSRVVTGLPDVTPWE
jgi:hypothetical protein